MNTDFRLFPEQASSAAPSVDTLFLFIVGVSVFFSVITAVLLIYFALRYRRKSPGHFPRPVEGSTRMEALWALFLLVMFLLIFFWGAFQYLGMIHPPENAMEVYVVGKQWMWHLQHPEGGQREINELHVPVGQPVKLTMTSDDVIHSFFIPAFRVKQDVVPGRFTYLWFTPTKTGSYHIFCAQYCGTQHSRMVGWVHVMDPAEYQQWLSGRADQSMALRGRELFLKYQCIACHSGDSQAKAPLLEDLYRKEVHLRDGRVVTADDEYIRRSIREPAADIVDPYQPIMPTFGPDQMSSDDLENLLVFIKTLGPNQTPTRNERTPAPESGTAGGK